MKTLRLLTWNVHGCVGIDGRRDVERIADTIKACDVDVALLQELDVARRRSGFVDQPAAIALRLGASLAFGAAIREGDAGYGNAILSRAPLVEAETLSLATRALGGRWGAEPRAATRALVMSPIDVELVVTHLGLWPADRAAQAEAITQWLGEVGARPRVVAGDLNALRGSKPLRTLMGDALVRAPTGATFPSRCPLLGLDHVLVDSRLGLVSAERMVSPSIVSASDHLPIVVTLCRPD